MENQGFSTPPPNGNGTHTSGGQINALEHHSRWVIGFGITDKCRLIHTKLLNNNLTSGDIAHVILPTHTVLENSPQGRTLVLRRIFPGYFLLGVTSQNPSWQEMESSVEEIFSILTHGSQVAFLKDGEKEHIVNMIKEIPHEAIANRFALGDRVLVKKGSFGGLRGRIVEMRGKTKAKVEIEIRSKTIPTVFSLFDLHLCKKRP